MPIIPWGANIDPVPEPVEYGHLRTGEPVELLFIGRDWYAKGGPIALEVLTELTARGLPARLTIVGCEPEGLTESASLRIIPQLDKSKPDDMARFATLFEQAHFLINPSFESYGFAYCEASAYGLPSLSFRVGGVPVREGVNGHALPVGSQAGDFANVILDYIANPTAHTALRSSSRSEYEDHLNWDVWGQKVSRALRLALKAKRS